MNQQDKQQALDLILICVQDICQAWPTVTLRTLYTMTNRIETLRQALVEYKKYL